MRRCARCRSTELTRTQETLEVQVPSSSGAFLVRVAGVSTRRCGKCGESFVGGPDLGRAELLAGAEAMARGLRDGAAFRFVRKSLGLHAAELAELLDVSAETISRWEHGHRAAELSVWNTLADLVSDKLAGTTTTLDRLHALAQPRIPKQPILLGHGGAK